MENPIDSTKKLLDLINEFGKTAGYKVNTQKSKHSCIPTTKLQKEKSGKKSHLHSSKKNKVPSNKLKEGGKRSVFRNYRTLKKEIKEDTNK